MDVEYVVRIDSAIVEPNEDESMPYRGFVESSWHLDGRLIVAEGSFSKLPMWILETGISQECWGLWEASTGEWDW